MRQVTKQATTAYTNATYRSSSKEDCPQCGHHSFYITPHNGLHYCFVCQYKEYHGTAQYGEDAAITFRRSELLQEIRAYYSHMTDYYHSCLSGEPLTYLYERGFTDTTISTLKIGFCPEEVSIRYRGEVALQSGIALPNEKAFLSNRITFPYISKNNEITDIRGRIIPSVADTIRYKSPLGGTYFRGADYPYNMFLESAQTLIVTEGEIKAAIAYQYGYPAIALPGMMTWRNGFRQKAGQKIIILFDSQAEGFLQVQSAIKSVALHFNSVHVATLPLLGKSKMDIDTFFLEHEDLFDVVIQSALPFERWLQVIQ